MEGSNNRLCGFEMEFLYLARLIRQDGKSLTVSCLFAVPDSFVSQQTSNKATTVQFHEAMNVFFLEVNNQKCTEV